MNLEIPAVDRIRAPLASMAERDAYGPYLDVEGDVGVAQPHKATYRVDFARHNLEWVRGMTQATSQKFEEQEDKFVKSLMEDRGYSSHLRAQVRKPLAPKPRLPVRPPKKANDDECVAKDWINLDDVMNDYRYEVFHERYALLFGGGIERMGLAENPQPPRRRTKVDAWQIQGLSYSAPTRWLGRAEPLPEMRSFVDHLGEIALLPPVFVAIENKQGDRLRTQQAQSVPRQVTTVCADGSRWELPKNQVSLINPLAATALRYLHEGNLGLLQSVTHHDPEAVVEGILSLPFAGNLFSAGAMLSMIHALTPPARHLEFLRYRTTERCRTGRRLFAHYLRFSPLQRNKDALEYQASQPVSRRLEGFALVERPNAFVENLKLFIQELIRHDTDSATVTPWASDKVGANARASAWRVAVVFAGCYSALAEAVPYFYPDEKNANEALFKIHSEFVLSARASEWGELLAVYHRGVTKQKAARRLIGTEAKMPISAQTLDLPELANRVQNEQTHLLRCMRAGLYDFDGRLLSHDERQASSSDFSERIKWMAEQFEKTFQDVSDFCANEFFKEMFKGATIDFSKQ